MAKSWSGKPGSWETLSEVVQGVEQDACFVCDGDTGKNKSKLCVCADNCGHDRCCGAMPQAEDGWGQSEDSAPDYSLTVPYDSPDHYQWPDYTERASQWYF